MFLFSPAMDEMFRTAPPPASSMCGAASCVRRKSEKTLSSRPSGNRSIGMSKGFGPPPPALFTRMVSLPKVSDRRIDGRRSPPPW